MVVLSHEAATIEIVNLHHIVVIQEELPRLQVGVDDRPARGFVQGLQSAGGIECHPDYLTIRKRVELVRRILQEKLVHVDREVLRDHVALAQT